MVWLENRYIDAQARHTLDEFVTLREQIADLDQRIARAEQDIKAVFKDQERLRQNLKALASQDDTALRERYVQELER